ncbi:uncharacterized protein PpBr36_11435 [Pyricularia pennisetigena]|uniref:uncharacterized protein n=1 Tax=Pyricularia pennisetigena TaxID=1578925 RepID=UPI001154B4A2|nr:uncharacterized protein PpBr36_11435 [Pyricularia pennisetigena]TLS20298.1 hypothetical protein PpBr36_11435 [Pyricularia pennisetigena]
MSSLAAERRKKLKVLKRASKDATRKKYYDELLSKPKEGLLELNEMDAMEIDAQELLDEEAQDPEDNNQSSETAFKNKIAIVQERREKLKASMDRTTDSKQKEWFRTLLDKPEEDLFELDDSYFTESNSRDGAEEQGQDTSRNSDKQPNNNTSVETGHTRGQLGDHEKPLVPFPGSAPDGNVKTVGWLGGWGTRYIMYGSKSAPTYRIEDYWYPPKYEGEKHMTYQKQNVSNQEN